MIEEYMVLAYKGRPLLSIVIDGNWCGYVVRCPYKRKFKTEYPKPFIIQF